MDGTFVNELERIVKDNKFVGEIKEVKGRTYMFTPEGTKEVDEKEYLLRDPICLSDLKSFCELIKQEFDKLGTEKLFIQIEGAREVKAFTILDGKKRRFFPYACEANCPRYKFGYWDEYENFVINLRSNFVETEDAKNCIKMIANIVNCDSQELSDNGVTQTVKTQRGTQLAAQDVKSILTLAPYRTFAEVEQPTSEYLFRIRRNGSEFALFEADGGRWELQAKKNIAEFIAKQFEKDEKRIQILM